MTKCSNLELLRRIGQRTGRIPEKYYFQGAMVLLLILFIGFSVNFPIQVDEILHYPHAQRVVDWYVTGGEQDACLYNSDTSEAQYGPSVVNLKYYGQSVDNLTALINRWVQVGNEYRLRHVIGALFAFLLVLFTSLTAFELSGKYLAAILTLFILLLVPSVMGQYCNNLKDIPFATGYAMSLWAMVRVLKKLPRVPWKHIILLAVAIAFTNSIRIGGLMLFAYLALFSYLGLLRLALADNTDGILPKGWSGYIVRLLFQGFIIVVIGYFGGLLFWPYGLISPLKHPFESLSMMEHYDISIRQVFRGGWYWSTDLPASYLPVWFGISLPLPVMAGFLIYLLTGFGKNRLFRTEELLIFFALLFPLFYVMIIGSNLYSGWRQMYFLVVPLSVLSGLGIERLLIASGRRFVLKAMILLLFFLGSIPVVIHYISRPDTSYVYFNCIAGGNTKAWSEYEYDYYWHGMKEAAHQLEIMLEKEEKTALEGDVITIASNFPLSVYMPGRDDLRFVYTHFRERSKLEWDYGVFGVNYIHPYRLGHDTWQPAQVVKMVTDGINPLALICARSGMEDIEALDLVGKGKYREAATLLESFIPEDSNNLLLHEKLVRCYYEMGMTEACEEAILRSFDLNPEADVPKLYEAQLAFDRGQYEIAMEKCLLILENNSKFTPVVPLLIASSRKTGNDELAEKLEQKYSIKSNN